MADLVSIVHRVLQIKDKNHTKELLKEVRELYEKLALLNYYEENADRLKHLQNQEDLWPENNEQTLEVASSNDEEQNEEEEPQAIEKEIIFEINEVQQEEEVEAPIEKPVELSHEDESAKAELFTPTIEETQLTAEQIEAIGEKDPIEDDEMDEKRVKLDIDPVYYSVTDDLFSQVETTPKKVAKEETTSKTLNDTYNKTFKLDLNDRIAFSSHLFDTSTADLNRVVSQINSFDTYEEVVHFINNYVKPEYNHWEGKEEYEQRFMEKIKKRFE